MKTDDYVAVERHLYKKSHMKKGSRNQWLHHYVVQMETWQKDPVTRKPITLYKNVGRDLTLARKQLRVIEDQNASKYDWADEERKAVEAAQAAKVERESKLTLA